MPRLSVSCLFCRIEKKEVPAVRVAEDEHHLAFLDHRPLFFGHCLLIPRTHYETLPEVPAGALGPLFAWAQELCRAMEAALGAEGTFVALNNRVSQSVPHLHVHVVPRRRGDGLRGFFWPRQRYESDVEAEAVASRLRQALADRPSTAR